MIGEVIVFAVVVGAMAAVGIGVGIILARRLDTRPEGRKEEPDDRDDAIGG